MRVAWSLPSSDQYHTLSCHRGSLSISYTLLLLQEARDAYYMKNYPDFFAASGKKMLKKPDGGFILVSDGEIEELKKKNRLTYEIPKAMAGQVVDYTQKPIWVLKDE